MSAQESERHKNQQRPLVLDTKGSVPQTGEVGQALVATTGLVWSSKGNYRSRALQQTQEADLVVVEEAQQTPDVKTTVLIHTNPCSLLLLVGDEQQAPGGIEDDPDLKILWGPLLNAPIGLRALPSEQHRSLHSIPRIIHQLLATLGPLDPALTSQHLTNVCNPAAPLLIHSPCTASATAGRATIDHTPAATHLTNVLQDALPLHLHDSKHAALNCCSLTHRPPLHSHLLGQADARIYCGAPCWGPVSSLIFAPPYWRPTFWGICSFLPQLWQIRLRRWRCYQAGPQELERPCIGGSNKS